VKELAHTEALTYRAALKELERKIRPLCEKISAARLGPRLPDAEEQR